MAQRSILHTGFDVTIPVESLEILKKYLGSNVERLRKTPYFCIHYQQEQSEMKSFYNKRKDKVIGGYIKGLWSSNDYLGKNTHIVVAHICVESKQEYIILSNNANISPIALKAHVNAGKLGDMIPIEEKSIKVECRASVTFR